MAELLYKSAAPQGGEQAPAGDGSTTGNGAAGPPPNDDVIDAEFKEAK
jgi:hypothetical protein